MFRVIQLIRRGLQSTSQNTNKALAFADHCSTAIKVSDTWGLELALRKDAYKLPVSQAYILLLCLATQTLLFLLQHLKRALRGRTEQDPQKKMEVVQKGVEANNWVISSKHNKSCANPPRLYRLYTLLCLRRWRCAGRLSIPSRASNAATQISASGTKSSVEPNNSTAAQPSTSESKQQPTIQPKAYRQSRSKQRMQSAAAAM